MPGFDTLMPWLIGGLAGLVIGVLWQRTRSAAVEERLRIRDDSHQQACLELDKLRSELSDSKDSLARLETRLQQDARAHEEKLKLIEQSKDELGNLFKGLSDNALKKNNQLFLDLAKGVLDKQQQSSKVDLDKRQNSINELLKPMKDQLDQVNKRNEAIDRNIEKTQTSLKEQLGSLAAAHKSLSDETTNLVNALRKPQVRGRWGEMTLKRVAELAGLKEHVSFDLQSHTTSDDGILRPDMVVNLPGDRQIVIDAKTSLEAYLDAHGSSDEAAREASLDRHAKQLRTHMDQLAGKAYWSQFNNSPEFVVMFVPGENFFSAALDRDPELLEDGIRAGVVLATPTTLISLLKAVGFGWRQEALADNARQISQLGRELYERLATVSEHLDKLGRSLGSSTAHFNKAIGSLETRVFSSARRFTELGVDAKKELKAVDPLDVTARSVEHQDSLKLTEPPDPERATGT